MVVSTVLRIPSQAEEGLESIENLEETKGKPVREHVAQLGIRKEVLNRFKNFLRSAEDDGADV